jgi:regulator of RNase E activity RraB
MPGESDIRESLSGHEERNKHLLRELQTRGAELAKPTSIEHHFWAPTQGDAAMLAKALYERGYLILVLAPPAQGDGSSMWNIEAERMQSPEEAAGQAVVEMFVRLAASFNSEYDGWGTSI